ncbi:MAG: radical SAM protein [Coriobacteriia bacterium]
MLEPITADSVGRIKNSVFRDYAQIYVDVEEDFRQQVLSLGLQIDHGLILGVHDQRVRALVDCGLESDNDWKSLHLGWVSPSCVTCRKGVGTETFLISVQCPRNCYFCFNPNQVDYEYLLHNTRDVVRELDTRYQQGAELVDIALTGGEPLLHKAETAAFFERAGHLYPDAYTRLYTSGALLDEDFLRTLSRLGLDEIRFSVKTDDPPRAQETTLQKIAMSMAYIPNVMVEMPVLPDNLSQMKELLVKLDNLGISGINLLEFCFPLHNVEEFAKRGYKIKPIQYRVLYDYWYAGGLPIADSEENCLLLLEFALHERLKLGVHYCSLENKFTGQIYLQNIRFCDDLEYATMSEKDYFLKTAKVFGDDVQSVERILSASDLAKCRRDAGGLYLELPVSLLGKLSAVLPNLEIGISYCVMEQQGSENVLRELRVDKTSPSLFNLETDI